MVGEERKGEEGRGGEGRGGEGRGGEGRGGEGRGGEGRGGEGRVGKERRGEERRGSKVVGGCAKAVGHIYLVVEQDGLVLRARAVFVVSATRQARSQCMQADFRAVLIII